MNDLELFGLVIRERRRALKLTQDELAEKADLHAVTIARIEVGGLNITFKTLTRLALALDTTLCDLFCMYSTRQESQKP